MKKNNLHILFGITGLMILLISSIILENVIFNYKDTYYVIDSRTFGFGAFAFYIVCALIYFSIKKSAYFLGILNLSFVTLYALYLMFMEVILEIIPPREYLENPMILKINSYLPLGMFIIFILGNMFMVLNVTKSIIGSKPQAST